MSSARPEPQRRASYPVWRRIQTRWADNDMYGHVNNVVYYNWFDTAVNALLIERGALEPNGTGPVGYVVETACSYFAPLSFPQVIEVGLRVAASGRSSVRYEIGVFASGANTAAAQGHFVHVYVDRATRRPVPRLPEAMRQLMEQLGAGTPA